MPESDKFFREEVAKTVALLDAVRGDVALVAAVGQVAALCAAAIKRGNKILLAGNGGSAADAQHLAAELVGRLTGERPALAAIALTTDTAILTAVGNDYGFDEIFRRQIEAIGIAGDVFVGISTSGGSKNVLNALSAARAKGITTIGMTGATGGGMAALCDHCLKVPSRETQKIQEAHIVLGHILCGLIERAALPKRS
jgi:D-sedoheptulose 7-phosphate isomerase